MNHLGLFEGIGGFSLAAKQMGWETKAWCEINTFCQQVLKYYYPTAEAFTDIKQSDFKKYANGIDILTGGFPCQPYSQAGKRLGKEDERHLWPEMLRAIREVQPGWVVGENVRGLTNWNGGLVFDEVQADLEAQGYEVLPFLLPACAKDAPHRRDRIWFIAYSDSNGNRNNKRQDRKTNGLSELDRKAIYTGQSTGTDTWLTSNSDSSIGRGFQRAQSVNHEVGGTAQGKRDKQANTTTRLDAINANGNWSNFPTQSPLCSRNDGFSPELSGITFSKHRNESIKAYGNAIVPQVALEIFKAIELFVKNDKKQILCQQKNFSESPKNSQS